HLDADPWYPERPIERADTLQKLARTYQRTIVSVNHIGTAQSILYDGRSMVVDSAGNAQKVSRTFEDDFQIIDTKELSETSHRPAEPQFCGDVVDETLDALIFGLRDNVLKSGFHEVVVGLSGGIDSAIVAA